MFILIAISGSQINDYIDNADKINCKQRVEINISFLEYYDPMNEDYSSNLNSYKIDLDDPGIVTVGYSK